MTLFLVDCRHKGNQRKILPGGLSGIADGLKLMEEGKSGGLKFVVHPQETVEA
jgi:hypothetical protein